LSKSTIEKLSDNDITELLKIKWIKKLIDNLNELPKEIINTFTKNIENISNKYKTTLINLEDEIKAVEDDLGNMLDELTGDEFDMKGLSELKSLLSGE
jgi:type I restriction enzyme M protein